MATWQDTIDPDKWAAANDTLAGQAANSIVRAVQRRTLASKIPIRSWSAREAWRDLAKAETIATYNTGQPTLEDILTSLLGAPPASRPAHKPTSGSGKTAPSPTPPSAPTSPSPAATGKPAAGRGTGKPQPTGAGGKVYDPRGGVVGDETLADISGAARMALGSYAAQEMPRGVHKLAASVCACRACAA